MVMILIYWRLGDTFDIKKCETEKEAINFCQDLLLRKVELAGVERKDAKGFLRKLESYRYSKGSWTETKWKNKNPDLLDKIKAFESLKLSVKISKPAES